MYPEFKCLLFETLLRDSCVQGEPSGTKERASRRDKDGGLGTPLVYGLFYSERIHCLWKFTRIESIVLIESSNFQYLLISE